MQKYPRSSSGSNSRLALEHDDPISKISGHDEIVLDDESGLLSVENESECRQFHYVECK